MSAARKIAAFVLIPECDDCYLFAFPELVHGLFLQLVVYCYVSVVHRSDTNECVDFMVRVDTMKNALAWNIGDGLSYRPS